MKELAFHNKHGQFIWPEPSRHFANNGLVTGGGTPADFVAHLKRDHEIWSRVIPVGGFKTE